MNKEQIKTVLTVMHALAEAIRELGEIPAGHLYAQVMGKLTHTEFEKVIGTLVRAELVRREPSNLLVWIGPEVSQ